MEKKWKCPNGCKMEYAWVEEIEITYNLKGSCDLDDIDLENVNYDDGHSDSIVLLVKCPVCEQVLAARR